jgi:mono/diheme cytochrome c family protein
MTRFSSFALMTLLLAGGCAGPGERPSWQDEALDPALVSTGRDVAVLRCSQCHALDSISQSPNPSAPPMARLLERYDAGILASDLIDGIRVGHDEMPEFDLQVIEADALVAYLKSLRQ